MVTPLARRRPWVIARHASTLSRLSGGRLILGTGLGSDESGDFGRFGEPADPRTRSAMESLIHFDPLKLSLEIVDAGPPRV
jgi:alkanesulfonate monooxygenase SsuD/methylene tetrahydromethanopterin reductase-like flavin-dependent oxidoreductase (luciferase family)